MVYIPSSMEDESQISWKGRYFERLKRVEALEAEIKSLREQLATNSNNSSKPPSQDPYRQKRNSSPSGRKQGGHSRAFVPPDQVTTMIDLFPLSCPSCAGTTLN